MSIYLCISIFLSTFFFLWRSVIHPSPATLLLLTHCLYFCTFQIHLLHSVWVSGQETQLRCKSTCTATSKRAEYVELSEGFSNGIVLSLGTECARFTLISAIECTFILERVNNKNNNSISQDIYLRKV